MKFKSVPFDAKLTKAGPDDGLEEGEFIVYPSTFTREPDAYGDVVAKGAFLDTIAKWKDSGNVLPGLYGHRMDDPDFFVAYATDQGEDDHGWWVRGKFDLDVPKALTTYRLVKGRRLNQLSFAYDVVDAEVITEDGVDKFELRKLDVFEFSFLPIGANRDTSVLAIKGIADALRVSGNQQSLREARDAIDSVLASIDADAAKSAHPGGDIAQEEASGELAAKDAEEPVGAKASEEPHASPSVDTLAAIFIIDPARIAEEGASR